VPTGGRRGVGNIVSPRAQLVIFYAHHKAEAVKTKQVVVVVVVVVVSK